MKDFISKFALKNLQKQEKRGKKFLLDVIISDTYTTIPRVSRSILIFAII